MRAPDLGIRALHTDYRTGARSPVGVVGELLGAVRERGDDGVWISLSETVLDEAAALHPADLGRKPLWGIPFAVKDNVDAVGLPTTAACPAYAYEPLETAHVVARLLDAGALLVGKTNLDQFATGLNGTRSPYGVPCSVGDPTLISGGSSSGSAVAVAAGLVSFAVGTDTAGSGRVPAALNGIVGVKPSIGLLSMRGVVPACASLDCPSVLALTVADGAAVHAVMAGHDPLDPWSRRLPLPVAHLVPARPAQVSLAVPASVEGWGSRGEEQAWERVLAVLESAGVRVVPIDLGPFLRAGSQLYGGAWLAERTRTPRALLTNKPDEVLPVIRDVLAGAPCISGETVFDAQADMRELRRHAHAELAGVDALLTPTVTTTFTIQQMLDDPVRANQQLGTYTTFTNLLDLCAVSVPAGETGSGHPFGVTLQAPAGRDDAVARVAVMMEGLLAATSQWLDLAVVGAHLEGMPLHEQLCDLGAGLVSRTSTSAEYRLYALAGGPPYRPGLVHVGPGGRAIDVEVYRLPRAAVGDFLAGVAPPLALGTVTLAGGVEVTGFVCEPRGVAGARDISEFGGWRAYVRTLE